MLGVSYGHAYLDVGLGFSDLSLQCHLVLKGQLPLLPQLGLQMITLLLHTGKLQTENIPHTHTDIYGLDDPRLIQLHPAVTKRSRSPFNKH